MSCHQKLKELMINCSVFLLPYTSFTVNVTGCAVTDAHVVRKCLFRNVPVRLVSSDAFLERLQKGGAVVSSEGPHQQPVPSDSGQNQPCPCQSCFSDKISKPNYINLIFTDMRYYRLVVNMCGFFYP